MIFVFSNKIVVITANIQEKRNVGIIFVYGGINDG